MTSEDEKAILSQYTAIQDLFRNKVIDQSIYSKMLLCVAYEYAIRGDTLRAVGVAQQVGKDYFLHTLARHMSEDPDFLEVAYSLSNLLYKADLVHVGPVVNVNSPGAMA